MRAGQAQSVNQVSSSRVPAAGDLYLFLSDIIGGKKVSQSIVADRPCRRKGCRLESSFSATKAVVYGQ